MTAATVEPAPVRDDVEAWIAEQLQRLSPMTEDEGRRIGARLFSAEPV